MSEVTVTSAREALMAQLLEDIDDIVQRLEAIDAGLAARIQRAVGDAAGQAFLRARLDFAATIAEQERRLTDAGRHAAALVGNQLREGAAGVMVQASVLERSAVR